MELILNHTLLGYSAFNQDSYLIDSAIGKVRCYEHKPLTTGLGQGRHENQFYFIEPDSFIGAPYEVIITTSFTGTPSWYSNAVSNAFNTMSPDWIHTSLNAIRSRSGNYPNFFKQPYDIEPYQSPLTLSSTNWWATGAPTEDSNRSFNFINCSITTNNQDPQPDANVLTLTVYGTPIFNFSRWTDFVKCGERE